MAKKTKPAKRNKTRAKTPAKAKKPEKPKTVKAKPAKSAKRVSWVDTRTQLPLIDTYARQLDSFMRTMADGKVDESEIKAQEKRLVELMKEIEPTLDDKQHGKVTLLLCELTAYDIMQLLYTMNENRPKTTFRG